MAVGPVLLLYRGGTLMHPLHDYIIKQLAEKLRARKLVVWYDIRREFAPFIAEMRGSVRTSDEAVPVEVGSVGRASG